MPQVAEQTLELVDTVLQEHSSERIVALTDDLTVTEEILEVAKVVDHDMPQITKKICEVRQSTTTGARAALHGGADCG